MRHAPFIALVFGGIIAGALGGAACSLCGDGTCDESETCTTCPSDCGACAPSCGDGTCDSSETCSSCEGDCGTCSPTCLALGDGCAEAGACCSGTCTEGVCACATGLEACGDSCVDVSTDPDHCGGCFTACWNGTCQAGACMCPEGWVYCSGGFFSGCMQCDGMLTGLCECCLGPACDA